MKWFWAALAVFWMVMMILGVAFTKGFEFQGVMAFLCLVLASLEEIKDKTCR